MAHCLGFPLGPTFQSRQLSLYPVLSPQLVIISFSFFLGIQTCAVISFRGIGRADEHKIAFHTLSGTEPKTVQGRNGAGMGHLNKGATPSILCVCPICVHPRSALFSYLFITCSCPSNQYSFYCIFKMPQISLKIHPASCCSCSWTT